MEFVDGDSLECLQLGPLLGTGKSMDSMFLMATWPYSVTHKLKKNNERVENTTWLPAVKRISDSLKLCQTGVDEYGDPLTPGGHRFTVWGITGDNEHHANFFGCPHWSMREWCAKCDCNKTTKDGLVISKKRKYTEHEVGHKPSTSPIMDVPGMCASTVEDDTLHDLFTHGVCSHLMGSALHTMIYKEGKGKQKTPPAMRLSTIFQRIKDICKARKIQCPLSNISLSSIHTPDKPHGCYPFFKAKGHHTKELLPIVAKVVELSSDGSDMHCKRSEALNSLSEFCALMDRVGHVPSNSQADRARELFEKFAESYEWLNAWAKKKHRMLFKIVHKHHYTWHMSKKFKFLNPKLTSTFKGEDYVGQVSLMGNNCSRGKSRLLVASALSEKYREHMHLRLTRGDFLDMIVDSF